MSEGPRKIDIHFEPAADPVEVPIHIIPPSEDGGKPAGVYKPGMGRAGIGFDRYDPAALRKFFHDVLSFRSGDISGLRRRGFGEAPKPGDPENN